MKMVNVFNENGLKQVINKAVEKECGKYSGELDSIWKYLNKLREEVKAVESLINCMKDVDEARR